MIKVTANGVHTLESYLVGTYHELETTQTRPLYSCVPVGTAIAHVKVG